jgi:tRNA(His) 5'-end guanylyltransferase
MKNLISIFSLALLVLLFVTGCSSNSEKEQQPTSKTDSPAPDSKKTDIMKEWLVDQAFRSLPEKKCLRYQSFEDSANVTILLVDTCSDKVSIMYTTILGNETVSFERKYPGGKTLTLIFSYAGSEFTVLGSKIVSGKEVILLDQQAIAKIVQANYEI